MHLFFQSWGSLIYLPSPYECQLLAREDRFQDVIPSAHAGQLSRAAVELAKLWRTDKYLRRLDVGLQIPACPSLMLNSHHSASVWLHSDCSMPHMQAVMVVADKKQSLLISGTGDVVEPNDGIIGLQSQFWKDDWQWWSLKILSLIQQPIRALTVL